MKCEPCLTGRQIKCQNFPNQFGTGNLDLGCFGSAIAWDVTCLFKIPEGIASEHAGPLMCGGATVWGPLYEHGIRAGERIGIVGIGGLGQQNINHCPGDTNCFRSPCYPVRVEDGYGGCRVLDFGIQTTGSHEVWGC